MKKKTAASFLIWFLILLSFLLVCFFRYSFIILSMVLLLSILPIGSGLLNLYNRRKLTAKIRVKSVASKNEIISVRIGFNYKSLIPVNTAYSVRIRNRYTGETETKFFTTTLFKGKCEDIFEIKSLHCGYLRIELSEVYMYDLFGFIPVRVSIRCEGKVSVLPDTFSMNVSVAPVAFDSDMAESWSGYKKGDDVTEIFGLKDYIPGDDIRQIHWKLSSKLNKPIIREASLPIEESLMLFWDKNSKSAPESKDAMAEIVATIGRELSSMGIKFIMGYTVGKDMLFEDIDSEEKMLQIIPEMLKTGEEEESQADYYERLINNRAYGKLVYMSVKLKEQVSSMSGENIAVISSDVGESNLDCKVILFNELNYLEELQTIEI